MRQPVLQSTIVDVECADHTHKKRQALSPVTSRLRQSSSTRHRRSFPRATRHEFSNLRKYRRLGLALRQIRPAQTRQPGPVILRHQVSTTLALRGAPLVWAQKQSENTQRLTQNSKAYSINAIEGSLLAAQYVSVHASRLGILLTSSSETCHSHAWVYCLTR